MEGVEYITFGAEPVSIGIHLEEWSRLGFLVEGGVGVSVSVFVRASVSIRG